MLIIALMVVFLFAAREKKATLKISNVCVILGAILKVSFNCFIIVYLKKKSFEHFFFSSHQTQKTVGLLWFCTCLYCKKGPLKKKKRIIFHLYGICCFCWPNVLICVHMSIWVCYCFMCTMCSYNKKWIRLSFSFSHWLPLNK